MNNNVKIADSVIYLIWSWQGIIIDNVEIENETTMQIHLSIPSHTFVKNSNGQSYSYLELLPRVQMMTKSLAFAMKVNQGINTKFVCEQREDDWTLDEGKLAVQQMTLKLFFNNPPFEEVF